MAAAGTTAAVNQPARVLVAVCGEERVRREVAQIGQRLTEPDNNITFVAVPGLCFGIDCIPLNVANAGALRLVLGLCSGEFSPTEVDRVSRRAGLNPFGVQVVAFRRWRDLLPDKDASAGAVLALSAATARARAFTRSWPEQSKAVFSGLSEPITRRSLFHTPPVRYVPVPAIDRDACVAANGCRECIKACPHGALSSESGLVRVDRSACKTCGLCVTACPQRAVDLPGYSAREIEAQLERLTVAPKPTSIVFACRNVSRPPGPGWQPVQVACAGMVPAAALLSAVSNGAQEVGIYRCTADCANKSSGQLAGTVDYCRQVLQVAGESPDRIRLLPPGDEDRPEDPSAWLMPPTRARKTGALGELFGAGAAGRELTHIARDTAGGKAIIDHASSPVALPEINPAACTACGTCSAACPTGAIHQTDESGQTTIVVNSARCIGCGDCVASCPEREHGAISIFIRTDMARLSLGPQTQFRASGVRCRNCGAIFTTREVLQRLKAMLGNDYREDPLGTLCPDCRGR